MLTEEDIKKLSDADPHWFEEYFFRDLDGWFSSDIACCDECYDDFLYHWPHAYSANEAEFQRNSIDLDSFYEGGRLKQAYTKEEFYKFLPLFPCPRCGNTFKGNIWPYNFPFDIIDDFEDKVKEISNLFENTPFLLLEHDFAKDVLLALKTISCTTEPKILDYPLYRARTKHSLKAQINPEDFDFSPKEYVTDGRYNHAGIPVLYLASDPKTCFYELREQPCVIGKIEVTNKLKVLDLVDPYESHQEHSDLLNTLVYSALMSAKHNGNGAYKPAYIFSRFVSDCAKYSGFDAIRYPSTRYANNNFNLVLLNSNLSLQGNSILIDIKNYEDY